MAASKGQKRAKTENFAKFTHAQNPFFSFLLSLYSFAAVEVKGAPARLAYCALTLPWLAILPVVAIFVANVKAKDFCNKNFLDISSQTHSSKTEFGRSHNIRLRCY